MTRLKACRCLIERAAHIARAAAGPLAAVCALTLSEGVAAQSDPGSASPSRELADPLAPPVAPPAPGARLLSAPPRADITLDGDIAEWPQNVTVAADSSHLYFRVTVASEAGPIQAMRRPLLARFDLDGSSASGARYARPPVASDLGIDMEIVFSPRDEQAHRGFGVAVSAVGPGGELRPIGSHEIDLRFAPSYASQWYEGRISLAALIDAGLPRPHGAGVGRLIFVLGDGDGGVAGRAPPATFQWPRQVRQPDRAEIHTLAKAPGDVRIMSWNVAHDGPVRDAAAFARIIRSLAPDILLLQEWDDATPVQIRNWFAAHVVDDDRWSVVASAGRGAVIVARTEVAPLTPARIQPDPDGYPVRFSSALAATEAGPIALGSIHLRCCGYAGSEEDRARMTEAVAINKAMRAALGQTPARAVVLGGDLNLVGTFPPLEALAVGLDTDGSALEVAGAFAAGDHTQATWSSRGSIFTPARLDYVLYSGASAAVSRTFVLDTRLLSVTTLDRLGLSRDDAHASDHRPVIVDLRIDDDAK